VALDLAARNSSAKFPSKAGDGEGVGQPLSRSRVRFYAAAPIVLGGAILGAFFVMDYEPRTSCPIFMKCALLNCAESVSMVLLYSNTVVTLYIIIMNV
jgi:hypothetical protein